MIEKYGTRRVRKVQAGDTVVDDEYGTFVEEMNGKSFTGIQRVYMPAVRPAPQLDIASVKQGLA